MSWDLEEFNYYIDGLWDEGDIIGIFFAYLFYYTAWLFGID
jgi:hypothetical protein